MGIKQLIILFLSVVSGICHSQQWMLRLKPMAGSPILSFQHFEKIVYDPAIMYSNGTKPSNISFTDNIEVRGQYNLELFADVYEWNQKWRFGIGMGSYNGSRVFLKVQYDQQNSKYIYENQIDLGNSGKTSSLSIGPVDFNSYVTATRSLNTNTNGTNNINQFLSMGAGFTKNKKNPYEIDDPYYGKIIYTPMYSHNLFPFLLFRYELEFLSKRGNNLFNLTASYQQGIFKVATLTWIDTYNAGTFYSQQAHTRGSSLSISISKPFYIKRPKKSIL